MNFDHLQRRQRIVSFLFLFLLVSPSDKNYLHQRDRHICQREERSSKDDYLMKHCEVDSPISQHSHLFANVFFTPLTILPNHIKFMTPSAAGTPNTRAYPKMCILMTYNPKNKSKSNHINKLGYQIILLCVEFNGDGFDATFDPYMKRLPRRRS